MPHPFFYESIFSLHIDFLNSSRWLPAGVPMKLKFIRNDDNFVIIANTAPGTYKIKIIELFVEFRKIGVDISIMKRELAALGNGEPYVMPFLQGKQMIFTIPQDRSSFMLNEMCSGNLPKQLLVSFVRHDAYNNDIKKNGYIFENLDISNLVFKVNNENSPPLEYKPNFSSTPKDCLREYQHLMSSIGKDHDMICLLYDFKDFISFPYRY